MADYYLSNGHNEDARQLFERLVSLDFFVPFFNRLLFVCFIDFLLQSSETGPDATVFFLERVDFSEGKPWMVYLIFILQYQIWCLEVIVHFLFASSYIQIGTDFVTDRDFAALDFLDHELLGDGKPERPYNETVDYGLEKFVLQF